MPRGDFDDILEQIESAYRGAPEFHHGAVPKPALPERTDQPELPRVTAPPVTQLPVEMTGGVVTPRPKPTEGVIPAQARIPTFDTDRFLQEASQVYGEREEKPIEEVSPQYLQKPYTPSGLRREMVPVQRSALFDVPTAVASGVVDTGEIALRAMGALGLSTDEAVRQLDELSKKYDILKPPETPSAIRQSIYGGVRSFVTSALAGLPAAVAGMAIGGPIGALVGFALGAGTLFGLAEYKRFLDDARNAGIDPEKVRNYALLSGLVEGGTEAVTDLIAGRILGVGSLAKQSLSRPIKNLIAETLKPSLLKYGTTVIGKQMPLEVGTEMFQEGMEAYLRQVAGVPTETPFDAAKSVIGPTMVSTVLFGIGARIANSTQARFLKKVLENPNIDPEHRRVASKWIYESIMAQAREEKGENRKQLEQMAGVWRDLSDEYIAQGKPVNIEASVLELTESYRSLKELEEARRALKRVTPERLALPPVDYIVGKDFVAYEPDKVRIRKLHDSVEDVVGNLEHLYHEVHGEHLFPEFIDKVEQLHAEFGKPEVSELLPASKRDVEIDTTRKDIIANKTVEDKKPEESREIVKKLTAAERLPYKSYIDRLRKDLEGGIEIPILKRRNLDRDTAISIIDRSMRGEKLNIIERTHWEAIKRYAKRQMELDELRREKAPSEEIKERETTAQREIDEVPMPPPEPEQTLKPKTVKWADHISHLIDLVKAGESGGRAMDENGNWTGWGSTYPPFMRNKGWTKNEVITALEKGLRGEPLGERQQEIWNAAIKDARETFREYIKSEKQKRRQIHTADLEVGDVVIGDTGRYTVVSRDDTKVVLRDESTGDLVTYDAFFEFIYGKLRKTKKLSGVSKEPTEIHTAEEQAVPPEKRVSPEEKPAIQSDIVKEEAPTGIAPDVVKGEEVMKEVARESGVSQAEDVDYENPEVRKLDNKKYEPSKLGLAWYKDQFVYFMSYREIQKGKKKGRVEITLTNGDKVVVDPSDIKRYPTVMQTEDVRHKLYFSKYIPPSERPLILRDIPNFLRVVQKIKVPIDIVIMNYDPYVDVHKRRYLGRYYVGQNRIELYLSNIESEQQMIDVLFHELIGHHGLRVILGARSEGFFRAVYRRYKNDPLMEVLVRTYGYDRNNPDHQLELGEEFVSSLAEHQDNIRVTQFNRLAHYVLEFVRNRIGVDVPLTNSDLHSLLNKSYSYIFLSKYNRTVERPDIGAVPKAKKLYGMLPAVMLDGQIYTGITSHVEITRQGWFQELLSKAKEVKSGWVDPDGKFYDSVEEAVKRAEELSKEFSPTIEPTPELKRGRLTLDDYYGGNAISGEIHRGKLFNIQTAPDTFDQLDSEGKFSLWLKALRDRKNNFAEGLPRDLSRFLEVVGLPSWLAREFPNFKPTFRVETQRLANRNADRIHLLSDPTTHEGDNLYLKLKNTTRLDKLLILSDYNDEFYDTPEKLQEKANELKLGTLTQQEIDGYYTWKKVFDYVPNWFYEKSKKITLRLFENEVYHQALVDVVEGRLDPLRAIGLYGDKFKEDLEAIMASLDNAKKAADTMKSLNFYVPRTRKHGPYVVYVYDIDNETMQKISDEMANGETLIGALKKFAKPIHAERTDSLFEAEKIRIRLAKEHASEGRLVVKFEDRKATEWIYDSVSFLTLESFLKSAVDRARAGIPLSNQEKLDVLNNLYNEITRDIREQIMARGQRKHLIRREKEHVITGYRTENLKEVMYDYLTGLADSMNKLEATHLFYRELKNIDPNVQPRLYEYAVRYARSMLRNTDEFDTVINRLKVFPFAWYLATNLRMMAIQLTQNFTTGIPILNRYIKEHGGKGSATTYTLKAMSDIIKGKLSDEEVRVLEDAHNRGETMAMFVENIKGQIKGGMASNVIGHIVDITAKPFTIAETFNRRVAILASFRAMRDAGVSYQDAYNKAIDFVEETHYAYGRANLPQLLREGDTFSRLATLPYQFRSFTHNYLYSMFYYMRDSEGRLAFDVLGRSLAFIVLFGGIVAFPFLNDILDILEKLTGNDYRNQMKRTVKGVGGEILGTVGLQGLPALIGVDISGSLEIGVPFIDVHDTVYGVWGGLIEKGKNAISATLNGDWWRALEYASPFGIESILKAKRQVERGLETRRGRPILDEHGMPIKPTTGETIRQLLGFRPQRIAEIQKERRTIENIEQYYRERRAEIYEKLRRAKTVDEMRDVMQDIYDFNQEVMKYKGYIAPITKGSVQVALKPEKELYRYRILMEGK